MKRTRPIALLLAVFIVVSFIPVFPVSAQADYATRGDVVQMLLTAADDYNPDVKKTDIIKGHGDGNLREEEVVTRVQALVMLKRAFGGIPTPKGNNRRIALPTENFTDIPEWAKSELAEVFDAGIVAGTGPGTFSPDKPVTKEQMKIFINRTYAAFGSNPKDSFYSTINKAELESADASDSTAVTGTIYDLEAKTDKRIHELIKEIAESEPKKDSPQEKIKILYNCITDMDARNAQGYSIIASDLKHIRALAGTKYLGTLTLLDKKATGISMLCGFSYTVDIRDSTKYLPIFITPTPRMPKSVYNGEAETQKEAYLQYMTTLLKLCGETDEDAEYGALNSFLFEKNLSDASLSAADSRDIQNQYKIISRTELADLFDGIPYLPYIKNDDKKFLITDMGKTKRLGELLTDEYLYMVKDYLKVTLIMQCAPYLGEDFRNAAIEYNNTVLGTQGSVSLEGEASDIVASLLGDYVARAYVEKYCSDQVVFDITRMVYDIADEYEERIAALDWMSEETKQKAIMKLYTLRLCIGAPDYSKIQTPLDEAKLKSVEDGGSYYSNMLEISLATRIHEIKSSGGETDRDMWIASPLDVNAFYMANFNSITIPIAFLQPPIYDPNASYEEKLGSIGSVIAHELTHAFDVKGSQFDEDGNVASWWSDSDKQEFDRLCGKVETFFDGVEAAPGIFNNGTLTLSENIADIGALACITSLGEKKENFDFAKMYEAYAKTWLTAASRETLQLLSRSDEHSLARVRVDRALQTIDKFYEVYDIKETDGMYVAPEDRVRIW